MRSLSNRWHTFWTNSTSPRKVVLFLIVIALFLRLWNIDGSLQFLGDQGRDALVVSRIFTELDPVFIGPVTSVGNMYLGPLYYYFMLPWLWLTYPSPVGPAYAVGFLGVLTVAGMYFLGKRLVGEVPAVLATFFLTFSSIAVYYTRFSWNPNPAPLVSLLMIYCTYLAWKKNIWYWVGVAICFSILIQLHYLTLLSALGAGVIWLVQVRELLVQKRSADLSKLGLSALVSVLVVLASLTPLMLFDWKHDWLNARGFVAILFNSSHDSIAPEGHSLWRVVQETHGRSMHILFEWTIGKVRWLNTILVVVVLGALARYTFFMKSKFKPGAQVVLAYLLTSIIGISFYQHSVFDHYIAYLFPVTFLTYGLVLTELTKLRWRTIPVGGVIVLGFTMFFLSKNLLNMPLEDASWSIYDIQRVSDTIHDRVQSQDLYNIVLLSETGDIDAQNYRYYLSTTDKPPVRTEDRGKVDTLFIINETFEEKVTDSPVYEIVVFPNKEPSEVYTIENGPEVTVLKK